MATNDDARLRGKVVKILSSRELVINLGAADGVTPGMKFAILHREGRKLRDPDTGGILGTVELPKTVVKVVRIHGDNLAVGRTFRTIEGTLGLLPTFSGTPARTETLDIDRGLSLKAELSPEERRISVGDVALETEGDEYDDLS